MARRLERGSREGNEDKREGYRDRETEKERERKREREVIKLYPELQESQEFSSLEKLPLFLSGKISQYTHCTAVAFTHSYNTR